MLLAVLGSIAFVAAGGWMVSTAQNDFDGIAGLLGIVFFTFTAIFGVKSVVSGRRTRFSPEGLEWGVGRNRKRVAWSNIEASWVAKMNRQAINVVRLKDPAPLLSQYGDVELRLAELNAKMMGGEVSLGWADRDRGAEEFDALLKAWTARYA